MNDWMSEYRARLRAPAAALEAVGSGQRIFVHMGAAAPLRLLDALCEHAARLRDVELFNIITVGAAPYAAPEHEASFRANCGFISAFVRPAVQAGRADYLPVFLHEVEGLFTSGALPLDVALIQTSPPDRHGNLSLGIGVDVSLSAARAARHLIVQVNPHMPRTFGDSLIHVSEAHAIVEAAHPLPDFLQGEPSEVHQRIAQHVAALIPDGATLQIGVGGIPEAVLGCLRGHTHLGVHTEMFSDGLVALVESGVITNARKTLHPHKLVTSFVLGTRRVYDFVDENPAVEFLPNHYVNDPAVIARNQAMVAVNSALEVDLTGQVCSDSIGSLPYSGFGGQVDFIRGAAHARGGVPIIALPATAKEGRVSRIVPRLKPGAGVVTSRADVHWVATEYGAVDLHGRNLRQRAASLIGIAHPAFREPLEREAALLFTR